MLAEMVVVDQKRSVLFVCYSVFSTVRVLIVVAVGFPALSPRAVA